MSQSYFSEVGYNFALQPYALLSKENIFPRLLRRNPTRVSEADLHTERGQTQTKSLHFLQILSDKRPL